MEKSLPETSLPVIKLPPLKFWRELAALALLGVTLSWAVPWFRALSQATNRLSTGWVMGVLGAMGVIAYLSAKLLNGFQIQLKYRQRAMVALLVVSIFAGLKLLLFPKETMPFSVLVLRPLWSLENLTSLIPNEFLVILAILLTWRRGAVLALDHIGPEAVQRDFKTGFGMYLAFVGLNTFVTGETIDISSLRFFFLFTLLAMGGARMSAVGDLRGGMRSAYDQRRLAAVLIGSALAASAAYWAGDLMGRDEAALATAIFGLLFLGVFFIAIPVLAALFYLLYTLLENSQDKLAPLLASLQNGIDTLSSALDDIRALMTGLAETLSPFFDWMEPIFRWLGSLAPAMRALVLFGSLVVTAMLVLIVMYIRERRLRAQYDVDTNSVLGAGDFLKMLQDALKNRWDTAAKKAGELLDFRQRRRRWAAARIRQIYTKLMKLCEEMEHPRKEAQTPLEFLPTLGATFPASGAELALITEAYTRVRYGELPETRQEVQDVEEAWRQVKAAAKEIKQKLEEE